MKTKIFSIVTILFLSLIVSAQIDRTQQQNQVQLKINLGSPKVCFTNGCKF